MKKAELPAAIAEVLGIEDPGVGWVSTGDTVTTAWHLAVGEALDVAYGGSKVDHMRRLLSMLGVDWDSSRHSSEHTASQGGGNVRREAYDDLLAALLASPHANLAARIASEDVADDARSVWVTKSIRLRRGQPKFRADLLDAYQGACAVTGSTTIPVLEAAHIRPFAEGGGTNVRNGLLLRSDVHTLFDLGWIGITTDFTVVLDCSLSRSEYASLAGSPIGLPKNPSRWPDRESLQQHLVRWGLSAAGGRS